MTVLLHLDPRTAGLRVFGRIIQGLLHDPIESRLDRGGQSAYRRSEEHTSELQSPCNLVCRLLLEKKKKKIRGLLEAVDNVYTQTQRDALNSGVRLKAH